MREVAKHKDRSETNVTLTTLYINNGVRVTFISDRSLIDRLIEVACGVNFENITTITNFQ